MAEWSVSREDRAWIAGLIEGEGCFTARQGRPGYYAPVMSLRMTDYEIVERLHRLSGLGSMYGPYRYKDPRYKPLFDWVVNRRDQWFTLVGMVWPYLGERRRQQVRDALAAWRGGLK